MVVDVLAIRFLVDELRLQAQHAKQLRSAGAGRTIGAIDHDFAFDPRSGDTILEPALIEFAQTPVSGQGLGAGRLGGRERRTLFNKTKNFLFDGKLELVRKLVPISAKDLDAVIGPRIMGSRDYNSGVIAKLARQIGDSWGGNYAGRKYVGGCRRETGCNRISDPLARFPRVLTDHYTRALSITREVMAESTSYGEDRVDVQREFTGNATNAVGAKELSTHTTNY